MTPAELLEQMFDALETPEDEDHIHFFLDQGYDVNIVGNADEMIFCDNSYIEWETVYCVSAGTQEGSLDEPFFYSRILNTDDDVTFLLVEPVVTYDWQGIYEVGMT